MTKFQIVNINVVINNIRRGPRSLTQKCNVHLESDCNAAVIFLHAVFFTASFRTLVCLFSLFSVDLFDVVSLDGSSFDSFMVKFGEGSFSFCFLP